MSNQLTLPSKCTSPVPLRSAVQEYIQSDHPQTHVDAFKWDIKKWETLRREAVSTTIHMESVPKYVAYNAQLVFIATKLPVDINLSIPYTRTFLPGSPPFVLSNLAYERVNILSNLAALYCQLATLEDRSNGEGIKCAARHFQHSAGVLSYIITSALPPLETSLPLNTILPADISQTFFKAMELLMLAQAQECFWQRAVMDSMKNILIAKLSSKTSSLYKKTLDAMEADSLSDLFPRDWIPHVRTKYHHFAAAALYRKSVDDLEGHRYGEELARLAMAKVEAKKGLEAARKGGAARTVQDDIKSLCQTLETSFVRAERDNDLIYHLDVPMPSSVPSIPDTKDMVMSVVLPGLRDPKTVVKLGESIFENLSGWGVKVALDIYRERKQDWVQREIVDRANKLDSLATAKLQQCNLPAALDALDRPISLPPSLLRKAEEVRLEDCMHRIPALMEDIERLAKCDSAVLDEALDILDQEAMEDEEMRQAFKVDVWTRPASHVANQEITDQARRYRDVLDRAARSDGMIRHLWDEWAEQISVLSWDEADIERAVPSSTLPNVGDRGSKSTQAHARALRVHLETLHDIQSARNEVVQRTQRVAEADDVAPRLNREATSLARWVEVRPEIFDNTIEEELCKYERFREEIEDNERQQNDALHGIEERNVLFLDSRREDPSVKARERALQSLDLAYHKYREIHKDLIDGIKFYNDFASTLGKYKENCKVWVLSRRKEVEWLVESLNSISLSQTSESQAQSHYETKTAPDPSILEHPKPEEQQREQSVHEQVSTQGSGTWERPPPSSSRSPQEDDFALHLPPPDSADWEAVDMYAPDLSHNRLRRERGT